MSKQDFYYKDASKQNSIDGLSEIFKDLVKNDSVIGTFELDSDGMTSLHNHMNSSNTWKSVSQWETGVQYKIFHPRGEITVSDVNRGETSDIFRETIRDTIDGITFDDQISFQIKRVNKAPVDTNENSFHISTYSSIRISSRKEFEYESARSSWVFGLSVVWEGPSKKEAEESVKKYFIDVSFGSLEKASNDVKYTTASFLEKLMDALFKRSSKRHIFIDL